MSKSGRKHDDPTGTGHKHRWECPAGHKSWERINDHVFCHGCLQERHNDPEVDPEWYKLKDTSNGEIVNVDDLRDDWPNLSDVPAY